jgi:hypothetical protein
MDELKALLDVYSELGCVLVQTIPSDDQIIIGHVRAGYEKLGAVIDRMNAAKGGK